MNNKGLIITASTLCAVIIGLIMYSALWADDTAYKKAVEQNTVKGYQEFLSRYPNSEFANDIQSRYDEIDYREAVRKNNENAYTKYLQEHPKSIYVDSVKAFVEEFAYDKAIRSSELAVCRKFMDDYPNSVHNQTIQKKIDKMETDYYKSYINIPVENVSRNNLVEYSRLYPNGRYAAQVSAKLNDLNDYEAFQSAKSSNNKYSWQRYIDNHPNGKYVSSARAKIREIEEREYYLNNSLTTGSQPYRSYYGSNYGYDYGRPSIRVNASSYSDVVVIVRYNNSNGRVAGHTYIRAGGSSTIYVLPERRYQVFFYYGKGWYPKKEMSGGVKGGFLTNESFSKDGESMYLDWGQGVTYTLTQQINGNFSTSHSSESEMF